MSETLKIGTKFSGLVYPHPLASPPSTDSEPETIKETDEPIFPPELFLELIKTLYQLHFGKTLLELALANKTCYALAESILKTWPRSKQLSFGWFRDVEYSQDEIVVVHAQYEKMLRNLRAQVRDEWGKTRVQMCGEQASKLVSTVPVLDSAMNTAGTAATIVILVATKKYNKVFVPGDKVCYLIRDNQPVDMIHVSNWEEAHERVYGRLLPEEAKLNGTARKCVCNLC